MSKSRLRLYRWRKKIMLLAAALPLLQATGTCDPFALNGFIASEFSQNLAFGVFGSVVRGVQTTLLTFFPAADLLQLLLGGNTSAFYTG